MLVEEFGDQGADRRRMAFFIGDDVLLVLYAESHRLPGDGVGVGRADDINEFPDAMGEDKAVHVHVILDDPLEMVVGILQRAFGHPGKKVFGFVHVIFPADSAKGFAAVGIFGFGRFCNDRMERFFAGTADLLDAARIPVDHFENGKCLFGIG